MIAAAGCAGCLALALLTVWRAPARTVAVRRLHQVAPVAGAPAGPSSSVARQRRVRRAASAAAAMAALLLVGGWAGVVLAVVAGLVLPRWLASRESARARRERQGRRAELPLVLDVLAACVAAGATAPDAVAQIATACRSTLADDLRRAATSLRSGAAADEAWRGLPDDLAPIGEVLDRSMRSGASGAPLLRSLAERLRAQRRADRLDSARRLGVHAAAPLGLCFLPGFVVLGLLPVVIGLASQVH
jgi:pilus assembly protein TadC